MTVKQTMVLIYGLGWVGLGYVGGSLYAGGEAGSIGVWQMPSEQIDTE